MPVLLTCARGFEELLRGDLHAAGIAARILAPGELLAESLGDVATLRRFAMVDRVAVPGCDEDSLREAENLCRAAGFDDDLSFRVGAHEMDRRRGLIEDVAATTGWRNDPAHWQLNVDADADRVEIGPLAWAARFVHLERLPATTPPTVAAGLLRLAKIRPGDRLLDPCAGVATIPIIDGLTRPDGICLAIDHDRQSVVAAARNVEMAGLSGRVEVEQGDARALDLPDGIADRIVADLPFGKKIGDNELNRTLYPALLREFSRVLTPDGRAVLITDDKRTFDDAARRNRELKVVKVTRVDYNGVTPSAYTVTRVRTRNRS